MLKPAKHFATYCKTHKEIKRRFFKKSSIFGKKRSKLSDQACGRKSFDRHYIFKQVF